MRKLVLVAVVLNVAGVALVAGLRAIPVTSLPPVGPTDRECLEAAQRKPDLVFSNREWSFGPAQDVPFGEVMAYKGQLTRVSGFLHVHFDPRLPFLDAVLWASHDQAVEPSFRSIWVLIDGLGPNKDLLAQAAPRITDRCARIEGVIRIRGVAEAIDLVDVRRLEVWTEPHRPLPRPKLEPPTPPRAWNWQTFGVRFRRPLPRTLPPPEAPRGWWP